ncbi:hypothetical protein MASR1M45_11740 [Candidatus Kapaibacterium sp.]
MYQEMINQVNDGARALRNAIIENDAKKIDEQIDRVLTTTKVVKPIVDSLKNTIKSVEGIALLQKLNEARPKYIEYREKILANIKSGNKEEAVRILFGEFRDAQSEYFKSSKELINFQIDLMNADSKEAEESAAFANLLVLVIGIIAFLIAIIVSYMISRSITNPVNTAVNAAENISKGNMNVKLDSDSKDETGMLLAAMKTMANNIGRLVAELNKTSEAAVQGKLDTRASEVGFEGDYLNIIKGVNSTLDAVIAPLNVTAEYVDRISKGDIPPKITDNYNGDFNEIKNNLNQCIDAVNLLVKDAGMLAHAARR